MRTDWLDAVDAEARTWLNTPYASGGRVKGVGVDCGGLIYETYNPVCGPFPEFPHYSPDWGVHKHDEKYLDFIMPFVRQIGVAVPGCISLFHLGLNYAHAAILLKGGDYIHAWGRTRNGRCTLDKPRTLIYMARQFSDGFPPKHFIPKDA